jgi:hypothetical protein
MIPSRLPYPNGGVFESAQLLVKRKPGDPNPFVDRTVGGLIGHSDNEVCIKAAECFTRRSVAVPVAGRPATSDQTRRGRGMSTGRNSTPDC